MQTTRFPTIQGNRAVGVTKSLAAFDANGTRPGTCMPPGRRNTPEPDTMPRVGTVYPATPDLATGTRTLDRIR